MSRPVRVRFAPSPTGPLHIGGVRTALFNYLFAKKNNGVFYLRIEDTDQNRFVPGAEQYIFEALEWLGISPSETVGKNEKFGPYRQSERKHLYKQYADQLIQSGWAYYAFDTPEALDLHRKQHEEQGKTFIYNWHNREKLDTSLVMSAEETNGRIAAGEDFVIRFKTPVNEVLELKDIIRGDIKFDTNLLDDKVLFKSDGMPTYHLANIVDDHLMETSHVIRGEEWLPSIPLHHLLYKAFGWEAPEFAHLPLILKPIGNGKLSKRDGDKMGFPVFPLEWKTEEGISSGYRETGYFPEAVINFLALLGWNDGTDQEIFSLDELVEKFDLNRVHKAGAKFDPEKNKWFNHQYLQKQSDEELAESFVSVLKEKGISVENNKLIKIVSSIKERANFVSDFWELADYFFVAPSSYDEKASKNWKEETPALMKQVIEVLESIDDFTSANIENTIKNYDFWNTNILKVRDLEINLGQTYFVEDRKDPKSPFGFKKSPKLDSSNLIIINLDNNPFCETSIFYVDIDPKERKELVHNYNKLIKEYYEENNSIKFDNSLSIKHEIKVNNKYDTSDSFHRLCLFFSILDGSLAFENDLNENADYNLVKSKPLGKIMQPLRLSLVGALKGPHLFDIIELIGKEETVKRILKAIEKI